MSGQALSIKNLLTGKIFLFFNSFFKQKIKDKENLSKNFQLIRKINSTNLDADVKIGLYKDSSNRQVVIKHYFYKFRDLFYWHIKNEANILNILKNRKIKFNRKTYSFAEIIKFDDKVNSASLITKYHQGEKLNQIVIDDQIKVINGILFTLKKITSELTASELMTIPKRTPFQILISFPYFLFRSLLRDTNHYKKYLRIGIEFFKNYSNLKDIFYPNYYLTHRDLHVDNILMLKNDIKILDPGFLVIWEKNADLAIIIYKYINLINFSNIKKLLNVNLKGKNDWKRFYSLLIYYVIQSLAVTSYNSKDYKFAKDFLNNHMNRIESMNYRI